MERDVTIAGPTLSSLIWEVCATHGNTEGLLFGKLLTHSVRTVDDSEPQVESQKTSVAVQNFLITGSPFSFYNSACHVDVVKLRTFIGPDQKLLGWFSIRRNTTLQPSFREHAVHKQLELLALSNALGDKMADSKLLFGIFTSFEAPTTPLHTFDYKFFRQSNSGSLLAANVTVNNLMLSSHGEYNELVSTMTPTALHSSLTNSKADFIHTPAIQGLEHTFDANIGYLQQLADKIRTLESDLRRKTYENLKLKDFLAEEPASDPSYTPRGPM
eukprot:GILJ01006934.1.p1 GENE.GILJ01006934.1~~GILJ01006934.1.p1  ORF type:complete len:272 (+),score=30.28 GILJ01006934.1:39-854(+)